MTAPRRPRSAWLLVGSTPSVWANVQRAGQRLRRFLAKSRWYLVRGLFRAAGETDPLAGVGVERGVAARSAEPLVVVRRALGSPRQHRQHRCAAMRPRLIS